MSEALAALEAELKRDPASRRFAELAREYQRLGRIEEACALCEQGLQRYPTLWQARLLLAQIQMAKGDLASAGASVQKILMPLPENVAANHLAGDIFLALGDRAAALKHYQVVDLFEPGRAEVVRRIAELSAPTEPQAATVPAAAAAAPTAVPRDEAPQTIPLPPAPVAPPAPEPPEPAAHVPAEAEPETLQGASADEVPEVGVDEPPVDADVEPAPSDSDFAGTIRIPTWTDEASVSFAEEAQDLDQTAPAEVLHDDAESFSDLVDGGDELGEALLDAHERTLLEMPVQAPSVAVTPTPPPPEEASQVPASAYPMTGDAGAAVPDGPALSTTTLAELYSQQGFPEKAVEIYQRILLQDPERSDVKRKVQELMQRISGEAPEIPEVQQEDVRRALRQRRVQVLEGWLRRVKEERHV